MNLEQAEKKRNGRESGYGEIGECTIIPLDDCNKYYVDISGSEGRWYRSIIETVYVDYQTPLKTDTEVMIKGEQKTEWGEPSKIVEGYSEVDENLPEEEPRGFRFKISSSELSIT